jgi:hypothetical protein
VGNGGRIRSKGSRDGAEDPKRCRVRLIQAPRSVALKFIPLLLISPCCPRINFFNDPAKSIDRHFRENRDIAERQHARRQEIQGLSQVSLPQLLLAALKYEKQGRHSSSQDNQPICCTSQVLINVPLLLVVLGPHLHRLLPGLDVDVECGTHQHPPPTCFLAMSWMRRGRNGPDPQTLANEHPRIQNLCAIRSAAQGDSPPRPLWSARILLPSGPACWAAQK